MGGGGKGKRGGGVRKAGKKAGSRAKKAGGSARKTGARAGRQAARAGRHAGKAGRRGLRTATRGVSRHTRAGLKVNLRPITLPAPSCLTNLSLYKGVKDWYPSLLSFYITNGQEMSRWYPFWYARCQSTQISIFSH
jgi:hypothetical protein